MSYQEKTPQTITLIITLFALDILKGLVSLHTKKLTGALEEITQKKARKNATVCGSFFLSP